MPKRKRAVPAPAAPPTDPWYDPPAHYAAPPSPQHSEEWTIPPRSTFEEPKTPPPSATPPPSIRKLVQKLRNRHQDVQVDAFKCPLHLGFDAHAWGIRMETTEPHAASPTRTTLLLDFSDEAALNATSTTATGRNWTRQGGITVRHFSPPKTAPPLHILWAKMEEYHRTVRATEADSDNNNDRDANNDNQCDKGGIKGSTTAFQSEQRITKCGRCPYQTVATVAIIRRGRHHHSFSETIFEGGPGCWPVDIHTRLDGTKMHLCRLCKSKDFDKRKDLDKFAIWRSDEMALTPGPGS